MDTESRNESAPSLDEITLSFQREAEALREIVRSRDLQIRALKAHSLCLRDNFKQILIVLLDKFVDADVQFHARKMIEQIDQSGEAIDKASSKVN